MGGGRGGLPDTKRGGGQSTSGPIYEKWGWGGVGGNSLQVHNENGGGGGGQFASGPLRKVGGSGPLQKVRGGGGGAIRFRSIKGS